MCTYTIEELDNAKATAERLQLIGWEIFCSTDSEKLLHICNGIGAEWMSKASRDILDKRFHVLQTAAMLHDLAYTNGTGTDEDFKQANDALRKNGYILAEDYYGWYNPLRYLTMNDARRLGNICDMFGRKAYSDAIKEREKDSAYVEE